MIKFVVMIPRRPDLSREEFMHLWRDVCVPAVKKLPGLRRYVISPAVELPDADPPKFEGLGELWFDSVEAGNVAMSSPEGQVIMEDLPNFADMDNLAISVTEEIAIIE